MLSFSVLFWLPPLSLSRCVTDLLSSTSQGEGDKGAEATAGAADGTCAEDSTAADGGEGKS
jgi:hypothetical protein